jgi:paraquat-inducible protein A
MTDDNTPLVCIACAQPHRWLRLRPGQRAFCSRCDAILARGHRLDASALLALTLAALLVFMVALGSELISIRLGGTEVSTNLPTALITTWRDGAPLVALLSAFTAVLAPALFIGVRLYLLVPWMVGREPPGLAACLRLLEAAARWNTVSVLGVAALLSLVRIADMAQARPGPGLFALGALVFLLAAIESAGMRHIWPPEEAAPRVDIPVPGAAVAIGLQRTWALLAAAVVVMVPANLLPMMSTVQALRSTPHTLAGGIAELWVDEAYGLAVLVFVASIVVPLLKIGALGLLAWSVQHAPDWRRLDRARLYRLVQAVGHWSMLDVYVVLLLVGMVRFGNLAGAHPGPGLLAFAAVVVLTMLATHHFDPRWVWHDADTPASDPRLAAVLQTGR